MRYGALSLLAFVLLLLLVFKNYETWLLPVEVAPEKAVVKKPVIKVESPQTATGGQKESTPIESYIFIAEKNLFTPERKEFPVFTPPSPQEVKKPIVRPQVILYGVTISDSYKSASVSTPGKAVLRGEREIMTVKIGDRIGEYKLAKILPDRIGLEALEDNFEVLLYDARAPKKRIVAKTENKPATVISTLAPPPGVTPRVRPTVPGVPVKAGVSEMPVPRSISPAAVPSPRSRRFTGERFFREGQAPAPR